MKRYEWGEEGENAENSVLESPTAERDFQRLEKQPTRLLNNQETGKKKKKSTVIGAKWARWLREWGKGEQDQGKQDIIGRPTESLVPVAN